MVTMTAQIPDLFFYKEEEYSIVGENGEGMYVPDTHGTEMMIASTACWRGYVLSYTLSDNNLILDEVKINFKEEKLINNVKPKLEENNTFRYHYKKINLKIPFTGTLLIGRDFIREMYVHMGFQRPMTFRKVIELEFKDGELLSEKDLSKKMEEQRTRDPMEGARPKNPQETEKWINERFSLGYESNDEDNP